MSKLYKPKNWSESFDQEDSNSDEENVDHARERNEEENRAKRLKRANSMEEIEKIKKELGELSQRIEVMQNKIIKHTNPKSFSNIYDPFPSDLTRIKEVSQLAGTVVSIRGDPEDKRYVVYWPGFSLDMSDYDVCRNRPGEITFIHQHVLIRYNPNRFPYDSIPPKVSLDSHYFQIRNMEKDVYCVRLPNGFFVRMDREFLLKLYAPLSVHTGNQDNLLERGKQKLARIPLIIFEEKKKGEERKAESNRKTREKM